MKHTLHGFSQKNAIDLELDDRDLMILRWFVDYKDTGKMVTKIINNVPYYWIKYTGIQEAFPITNWKKDTVYRRLKKMVDHNVLKSIVIKEEGTWTYYALGDNYIKLVDTEYLNKDTLGNKSEGVGNKSETSLGNKSDQYYSYNNLYSSININNKENIKESEKDTEEKKDFDYDEVSKKLIKIFPGKKTKNDRDKKLPKILKKYGVDEIIKATTRYAKEVEGKDKKFILNESTFWNGRYIDYLTENYEEESQQPTTPKRTYTTNVTNKAKEYDSSATNPKGHDNFELSDGAKGIVDDPEKAKSLEWQLLGW